MASRFFLFLFFLSAPLVALLSTRAALAGTVYYCAGRCSDDSVEIASDVRHSVEMVKRDSRMSGVVFVEDDQCCGGYVLRAGSRSKKIEGALTDVELSDELMRFFYTGVKR